MGGGRRVDLYTTRAVGTDDADFLLQSDMQHAPHRLAWVGVNYGQNVSVTVTVTVIDLIDIKYNITLVTQALSDAQSCILISPEGVLLGPQQVLSVDAPAGGSGAVAVTQIHEVLLP